MASLFISNKEKTLSAEIVPAHGGMIAQIYLEGKEILHIDRKQLETAPMAAGGMPILFPFSSKTTDDTYSLNGKKYCMPMHGLVKNDVFAVAEAREDRVRLWIGNSPSWKEQYYPFDFKLEAEYRIEGSCLETVFRITNLSQDSMPHYLGWHPFFKATDKKKTSLKQDMQVHYDYVRHLDLPGAAPEDLSLYWDDVFHTPVQGGFIFDNRGDGYRVLCHTDPEFQALVLCSWVEESMCIEPWCGLPDSINTGRLLQWIEPDQTREYRLRLTFTKLEL
ncbi:MAG TPA: hypothetical protein IAB84_02195 [Candidatus Choladousia intestinigallinarum]|nr:hypothetical protein [Candidatus Choladousia intestinigallinarum]